MMNLTPAEQEIINSAMNYRSSQPKKWQSSNKEANKRFQAWYDNGYDHLTKQTLPKIRSNNENLVQYWFTMFLWGQGLAHKRAVWEDRSYLTKLGTFGTGYACLTLSHLYVVALKDLTKKFPLVEGGTVGFAFRVLDRMTGEEDDRRRIVSDKMYDIAIPSILDAQVIQDSDKRDAVALRTLNEQLLIYEHFTSENEQIALAIQLVLSGKLTQALGIQPHGMDKSRPVVSESDPLEIDHVAKLKDLKKLLDLGLITEQDYAAKKSEILSRL